jgi:hypothetical protein
MCLRAVCSDYLCLRAVCSEAICALYFLFMDLVQIISINYSHATWNTYMYIILRPEKYLFMTTIVHGRTPFADRCTQVVWQVDLTVCT